MKLLMAICVALFSMTAAAVEFDSNVPADIQKQMVEDLNFMYTIQGSAQTELHEKIFNQLNGDSYKAFFENRIRSVGKSNCGGGNAVACVYPMLGKKMFITENYIKFEHPQIARLMVVYHEARHTEWENGNWSHAYCPTPFLDAEGNEIKSIWTGSSLAGEAACDKTPLGSYGSSTIMLKNISKFCENCNEKVRMDADIYAEDQLKRIISTEAKDEMNKDFASL
jgi:hypothetical protein